MTAGSGVGLYASLHRLRRVMQLRAQIELLFSLCIVKGQ